MRICRRASCLLGSAYSTSAAPPSVILVPPPITEPCPPPVISQDLGGFLSPPTNPEGPYKLSRTPWELLDDLSLSDPQEIDDLLNSYCVDYRACHLSSASMAVTSVKNNESTAMAIASSDNPQLQTLKKKTTLKKATMKVSKGGHTQTNANEKEEEGEEGAAQTWKCKRNDGKGWKCPRNASRPNSLCEYHLMKKCSYLTLEFASLMEEDKVMVAEPITTSKASSSSNAQKKKLANNYDATEGLYYYSGFGPSRGKRHRRNHPKKEEKVELEPYKYASSNHAKVETENGTNNGVTTGSDDVCSNNNSGRDNVNMERNKKPWRLPSKPVRVWSLMLL